jgi:hypothetical protein
MKQVFLQVLICLVLVSSAIAGRTALEMEERDVLLLRSMAARAYVDADHDHGHNGAVQDAHLIIDDLHWAMRPFYAPERPSAVGSIYYSADPHALIVAFHGSHWLLDWIDDARFRPREATNLSPALLGTVHTGFSGIIEASYVDMLAKIRQSLGRDLTEHDKVYFTGHSLGGALAILGGAMVASNLQSHRDNIKIVTFCAPRGFIGDAPFVRQTEERLGVANVLCFSTRGDVVPYGPQYVFFPYEYEPVGINIEISTLEKASSHYLQPLELRELAENPLTNLALNLDPFARHPLSNTAWTVGGDYLVGKVLSPPLVVAKQFFKMAHAMPEDDIVAESFRYAKSNYLNSSRPIEEVGQISLFSVQRNVILKKLYNLFI